MAKSHKTCMAQAEIIDTFGTYHLVTCLQAIDAISPSGPRVPVLSQGLTNPALIY